MPTGDITITVRWDDGTEETFVVAEGDAATLVKGDVVVKFKGKRTSSPNPDTAAKDYEITRAQVKRISYS